MLKLKNLKVIIMLGFWTQVKNKKLPKLNNNKEIMLQLFNFIWKEVSQLELLMLFTILMSVIPKIYFKKLLIALLQLVCLKKQENFMNKWKSYKKH